MKNKAKYLVFVGLASEVVILVLLGLELGKFLDKSYGWNGIGIAVGAALGIIIWLVHLTRALKQFTDDSENETDKQDPHNSKLDN